MKENNTIVVVPSARHKRECKNALVVDVSTYLAGDERVTRSGATVVNLCNTRRYLSRGYYVSLLADARGQCVIPTVDTLEGLQNPLARFRALREAGVDLIDQLEVASRLRSLGRMPEVKRVRSDYVINPPIREWVDYEPHIRLARPDEERTVLLFMGRVQAEEHRALAQRVYKVWPVPILRMRLLFEDGIYKVFELSQQSFSQLGSQDLDAFWATLEESPLRTPVRRKRSGPSLAVLFDESDPYQPSSVETIERLERISAALGLRCERIAPNEYSRLGEHDALFIRVLTGLDQPAFRFATQADALGMPVIDHPRDIIRCCNKVFLNELLQRAQVATPRTLSINRHSRYEATVERLGSPFVMKLPDGAFSTAVFKVEDAEQYTRRGSELFGRSPLLIAQEFRPTAYDWRIAVLNRSTLFACRYHMAPGHWQIVDFSSRTARYGRVEAVPLEKVPAQVVELALRAANLVGDGLYGVDIKDGPSGAMVIEINDNPSIDTGYEDAVEGDRVYERIVRWFQRRIPGERSRRKRAPQVDLLEQQLSLEKLRQPIGKPVRRSPGKAYRAWEVSGVEMEYVLVDRDLNALSIAEEVLATYAGHPASDVDLGLVSFSNELFKHVVEIKTPVPMRSLARTEELLLDGIRRMSILLATRFDAKMMPGGMHPWFNPKKAELWRRSNRRIYGTYERLFEVYTHGWANVQASHLNLPLGEELDAVAMMNAAALVVPYLPCLAASSPIYAGEIQPAVDNRLAFIMEHQGRIPESSGRIVPEYTTDLKSYRRDILKPMYAALDEKPDSEPIRHEFLNARGAVFKFSRQSMEVRILDMQECLRMDMAIACFTRNALREVAQLLKRGRLVLPEHGLLVEDFEAVVREGSRAMVWAPHLVLEPSDQDERGRVPVRQALEALLNLASVRLASEDEPYLALASDVIRQGSLSERIVRHLEPFLTDDLGFTEAARKVYIRLCECLIDNTPWEGRQEARSSTKLPDTV